ncbi:MAG: ATP-binding protein [Myxococcota bacterium]|nr:ATP-binding protein [Myxococcota bacterium]
MKRTQLRLGAGLALLVGIALLGAGFVAQGQLREREQGQLRVTLEERARLVARWVAAADAGSPDVSAVRPEARPELAALAERASNDAKARVSLIAPDGVVVADSSFGPESLARLDNHAGRPEVAAALEGRVGSDVRLSRSVGRRLLYLAVPAEGGGVVRLAVDLENPIATSSVEPSLARVLGLAGAAGLAIALLIGFVTAARAMRPLAELREVLVGFAQGDLSRRLPWRSRDELGDIARVMNRMAEELRDRIQDLTSEKEQLRAVLQGMVEGVLVVDRAGRLVLANPRLRELFGVWGEVAGRPALEVIRRTDIEQALEDAARRDEPVVLEVSAGENRERSLQMHAVRFPATGDHIGTVAVFHDVTELHKLERMRSEFVANVSHELKTPLTAIRGFAETLQAEGLEPEQRAQYLGIVLDHAGRLSTLIDDLLELSRIEGRNEPLALDVVDPRAVAESLLRNMAPRLKAREIEASLESSPELRVLADRRALEQVFENLLDNAAKYTDPGGRVRIRMSPDGDRVRIEISDTGIGIPEEDQTRVFERFYRVNKVRSRDLGGTGLGLAIVKHLVQAIEGEIFLDSREGKGTTFSILLPAPTGAAPRGSADPLARG